MVRSWLLLLLFSGVCSYSRTQGYLHTSWKKILDGNGNEIILKGIGTGNWLLQEGYMMKSADVAGTQHAFRQKLIETIGEDRTGIFYESWLDNHFTRRDIDSMKAWGFNSVRVAMHYKWLTLPIEDEPVPGQDTWLEEGFTRLDSLLDWCGDNLMYLILDLHAAPGGQGKDANISDYDPAKPSLWESADNRRKTVALWGRIAQRYAGEPWLGGYDLINEPNWDLPGGTALRQLYGEITNAIRALDTHHMIIVEGNWFANDYTGLTPPWDNNMVYSFHKYWTYNTPSSLNFIFTIRDTWNVPIWLGESGENSNSWFTGLIELCEQNQIGWSWWPVKKAGINNVLQVPESQKYNSLISFWKSGTPAITADQAFEAVLEWSDNHRIEKCEIKRDVIDAMLRQPHSNQAVPYRIYHPGEAVHAVNYDLGRSSFAYKDSDSANYHLNTNTYTNWNKGWTYRNDGVDIEKCIDTYPGGNGYNVGWTDSKEWLQYTIQADSAAAYMLTVRSSSINALPAIVRFTIDGNDACSPIKLPSTGEWNIWSSSTAEGIILPEGQHKVRLFFERGGSNINLFSLTSPVPVSSVPFSCLYSETNTAGNTIYMTLNRDITDLQAVPADFQVTANGNPLSVTDIAIYSGNARKLTITLASPVHFGETVQAGYQGSSVQSGGMPLTTFADLPVTNNLPSRYTLPAKIEAENFYFNNGFQPENCTDNGGGKNMGFANNGDYLDYLITVPDSGEYMIHFRIASLYSNGSISIRTSTGSAFETVGTLSVTGTGGWQNWSDQSILVNLPAGYITLRLYSSSGEYNINWLSISGPTGIKETVLNESLGIFPNPGTGIFMLRIPSDAGGKIVISIRDMTGHEVYAENLSLHGEELHKLNLGHLPPGLYMISLSSPQGISAAKVLIR